MMPFFNRTGLERVDVVGPDLDCCWAGLHVGFMCIKANISLRITIYIYCQLIRNLKGHKKKNNS